MLSASPRGAKKPSDPKTNKQTPKKMFSLNVDVSVTSNGLIQLKVQNRFIKVQSP